MRQEQKQLKAIFKEIEDLNKLSKALDISNIEADVASINAAKEKIEKNKQWLKRVGEDIYVDESVKVLNKMITQNNMAKAD